MVWNERGFAYDAVQLFGFGKNSPKPLFKPELGEIVIRYGGWSFQELRNSWIGKKFMHHTHDWYDCYRWSSKKFPVGVYRLRIPVLGSDCKTSVEQRRMLGTYEFAAPVVLAASALLAHHLETGAEFLRTDVTRCYEQGIQLGWSSGLLTAIHYWDDYYYPSVWMSSVRSF